MLPELEVPATEPVEKRKFNFRDEYNTNAAFKATVDEGRARRKERQNTQQLTAAMAIADKGDGKLY